MIRVKCKAQDRNLCYSSTLIKYGIWERIDKIMKRIYFWLKIAVWVLIFAVVFVIFYVNRHSHVTFNYLLGEATINMALFICAVFIVGALFTIGVLTLLNISRMFNHLGLKGAVKRLEKENAELKRKTHVL